MSDDIDMATAQFSYRVAIGGLANVVAVMLGDMGEEPPRWRPFKRAAWNARWDLLWQLLNALCEEEREQREP